MSDLLSSWTFYGTWWPWYIFFSLSLLGIVMINAYFLFDKCRSDPTENDSVEGLRPNARGPGLVTFGVWFYHDSVALGCFILAFWFIQCQPFLKQYWPFSLIIVFFFFSYQSYLFLLLTPFIKLICCQLAARSSDRILQTKQIAIDHKSSWVCYGWIWAFRQWTVDHFIFSH